MSKSSDIALALLDVRKSFRLLHGYTRRIRDTVEICSDVLSPMVARRHLFSTTVVTEKRRPIDTWWNWDCLPTVDWTFLFYDEKHAVKRGVGGEHRMISMSFIADEEYEKSDTDDPDPESFAPAESARSVVHLAAFKSSARRMPDWKGVWDGCDWGDELEQVQESRLGPEVVHGFWRIVAMEEMASESTVRSIAKSFREDSFAALNLIPTK